jgi:hypothetical protein
MTYCNQPEFLSQVVVRQFAGIVYPTLAPEYFFNN